MIQLTISNEKTRTLITLVKSDKERLEEIAKEENRSFNNLVETILKEYLKERS